MNRLWLKDFPLVSDAAAIAIPSDVGITVWHAIDGSNGRSYCTARAAPDEGWTPLIALQSLAGASAGERPAFHYVVETDVAPEHEDELNAWYDQEHLPGLADVPGTIRATRFRRASGSPKYLACYDLTTPATLDRDEWLAVRHTAWSSRVRPLFRNTRRTMYRPPDGVSASSSR